MSRSSGSTRFTYQLREWMSILIENGSSYREIGRKLGFHHMTISREFQRNSILKYGKRVYNPVEAERLCEERKHARRQLKIASNWYLLRFIRAMLKKSWSPDAISGYLKNDARRISVSHETIYKYIYAHMRDCIPLLARGHRKRYRRMGKYQNRRKTLIPERVSIQERPKRIELRKQGGHFEADTMVCRSSKGALLVMVERKTRLVRIKKLKQKTSYHVCNGIMSIVRTYVGFIKSITYDNGTENVEHWFINGAYSIRSYFCNPYHSWEKGSVEHVIGLIRRFIPKGTDLSKISKKELKRIEDLINNRPRKILNYKTPREMFRLEWCIKG